VQSLAVRLQNSDSAVTAMPQVDQHLAYWPKFLVHKNKQRLTKITQYLIRMRKLESKPRLKMVPLATRCRILSYLWLRVIVQSPSRASASPMHCLGSLLHAGLSLIRQHMAITQFVLCRKEQQTRRKLEKAETAAKLETTIENELLERLQKGTYGDIYNFPTREYLKVGVIGSRTWPSGSPPSRVVASPSCTKHLLSVLGLCNGEH
jgi:protein MAK16